MGRPPEKVTFMGITFERLPIMGMGQPLKKLPSPSENKYLNMSMTKLHKVPMNMGGPKPPPEVKIPTSHKTVMGSISGMFATTVVHPLDVVKVRMQLFPRNRTTLQMARRILDCEGAIALYAGLSAGLLRQATYTSTRLSVYSVLYDNYKLKNGKSPNLIARLTIAVVAGLSGAVAGTPSEVALVRMIAEGRRRRSACSPGCAPACKGPARPISAIFYLIKMIRSEGISSIWRGAMPTLARSISVSVAQIGTYTELQLMLTACGMPEGLQMHIYTSIVSSFFTAILSLPVDVVKTRYQVMLKDENRISLLETITRLYRNKGVLYFWRGFPPYYGRMCAHTMLSYIFLDFLTLLYNKRASK